MYTSRKPTFRTLFGGFSCSFCVRRRNGVRKNHIASGGEQYCRRFAGKERLWRVAKVPRPFMLLPFQGANVRGGRVPGCRSACPGLCAFGLSARPPFCGRPLQSVCAASFFSGNSTSRVRTGLACPNVPLRLPSAGRFGVFAPFTLHSMCLHIRGDRLRCACSRLAGGCHSLQARHAFFEMLRGAKACALKSTHFQ